MSAIKRTKEMDCLLCRSEKATKTNSHIVSGMLTQSILGETKKKAFSLNTEEIDRLPKPMQDSDKEDYILCPTCEAYLGFLERYVANNVFHPLNNPAKASHFHTTYDSGKPFIKTALNAVPKLFHLFIQSIIWRCSITSIGVFQKFKLNSTEEEGLRSSLLDNKSGGEKELITKVSTTKDLFSTEYVLFTADTFKDPTKNIVFYNNTIAHPYMFYLNQFILVFYIFPHLEVRKFKDQVNIATSNAKIKIAYVTLEFWNSKLNDIVHFIARISLDNALRAGKTHVFLR